MKIIGTRRELLELLNTLIPPVSNQICNMDDIKNGFIGTYRGHRVEVELVESYHNCSDDRLGLAWARLNTWKWDSLFGQEPEDFYDLPNAEKHKIIRPLMETIEKEFAERATSKAWWIHELKRTETEWRHWYFDNQEGNLNEVI